MRSIRSPTPSIQDAVLTHGHLPENDNHGGEPTDELVDATEPPDGPAADRVTIADFTYAPVDARCVPGGRLTDALAAGQQPRGGRM